MNFKFFGAILLVSGLFVGCGGYNDPQPGSELYNSTVSAFYDGVTAMEVGEDLRAQAKLNLVTELAPNEPASWANLALMSMRRNELPKAQEQLTVALDLDSTQSDILVLAAAHARMIGDEASQIRFLRKAVSTDSLNSRAIFELLEYLPYDSQESESLMANLMIIAPGNTAVILKKLEQSAITGSVDQQIIDELLIN